MENNPSNLVPETELNVPVAENVENVQPAVGLKDLMKQATGRDYSTDEDAYNGLQETYKYVSKKTEPQIVEKVVIPDNVVSELQTLKQQLKESNFYADHPELKAHKDLLKKFGDPEEAVKDPVVKSLLDIVKAHGESENQKSVLNSNRIAGSPGSDYESDLKSARESGNWADFMQKHKGVKVPE